MTSQLIRFANILRLPSLGLVQRLRFVFVLIILVIGSAVAVSIWQFRSLNAAQTTLLDTSVPVLVRTQLVEHALDDLVVYLKRIEAADTQDELAPIGRSVNEQFTSARISIAELGRVQEHVFPIDAILRQLSRMETGIQANIAIKRGLFRAKRDLTGLRNRLKDQQDQTRILVERIALDAARALDASVDEISATGVVNSEVISQRLGTDARRVGVTSQIALEIETVLNVVAQLDTATPLETLAKSKGFLQFRMRGVLQLLGRLPDTSDRTDLAENIRHLREMIFGPHGVLSEIEEYAQRNMALARQNEFEVEAARSILTSTERLVTSAQGNLTQAMQVTQATTERLILMLALAGIIVALIVTLAILFIVERQINKRIGLLTGSVMRIAAGDTDHKTPVTGQDELGRMAEALDIFRRNARELLRSNAELETFAYAAAHDLKSPLQAIHDLTLWTIEDTDNELSEASAENLALLQSRVTRMSALLNDLLKYTRIGTERAELVCVDWPTLVTETAALADPRGAFKITHDWDGDLIETYSDPLRSILLNLISNTIKHHDDGAGNIQIRSHVTNGRLVVEYSDDGPGISPEYHGKVFELFQTLQPRDETEGSGLGLAIIKKLVEHFDGTVTLRSDPGQKSGTTVIFDFPAQDADHMKQAA